MPKPKKKKKESGNPRKTDSGKYIAFYYVNRRRKQDTFDSKQLAVDWLAKMRLEKQSNKVYGRDNKIPIDELIYKYQREVQKSENSQKRDKPIIERWKRWFLKRNINTSAQITKGEIAEYEPYRRDQGVGQRTINIDIELISAILGHAWKHDRIAYNPIARYSYKNDSKPFEMVPTAEDINKILKSSTNKFEHDTIYTFLTLGMRAEELCFLQYSDVKDNVVHLREKTVWIIENGKKKNIKWRPK